MRARPRAVIDTTSWLPQRLLQTAPVDNCSPPPSNSAGPCWCHPVCSPNSPTCSPAPKFRRWLTADEATVFVGSTSILADVERDPTSAPLITRDPNDDYLVALACATDAEAIISGDPYLTELIDLEPPVRTRQLSGSTRPLNNALSVPEDTNIARIRDRTNASCR